MDRVRLTGSPEPQPRMPRGADGDRIPSGWRLREFVRHVIPRIPGNRRITDGLEKPGGFSEPQRQGVDAGEAVQAAGLAGDIRAVPGGVQCGIAGQRCVMLTQSVNRRIPDPDRNASTHVAAAA